MTRGIVIPAGGVVLLNHAWATIKVCMARYRMTHTCLDCTLEELCSFAASRCSCAALEKHFLMLVWHEGQKPLVHCCDHTQQPTISSRSQHSLYAACA